MQEQTIHEGRNIKRIREMLHIKQDVLANELGLSQQAISQLEQKEKIDDKILDDVARILKVPADAIRNMSDETAINYINSFSDNSVNNGAVFAFNSNFNLADKYLEQVEENKRLYEARLKDKDEIIAVLQRLVEK